MFSASISELLHNGRYALGFVVGLVACGLSAAGEPSPLELLDSIQFRMVSAAQVQQIRLATESAVALARQRLSREIHGMSWIRYLQLEDIDRSINALPKLIPNSTKDDRNNIAASEYEDHLELITKALPRFYGVDPGLEMAELVQLRERLSELVPLYRMILNPQKALAELERRKKAVRTVLESEVSDHEQLLKIEPHLWWFRQSQQAEKLISYFSNRKHPNIVLNVSLQGLTQLSQQSVSRVVPIQQQVDGREVRGTAQLTGSVKLLPLDSAEHFSGRLQFDAHVNILLSGQQGRLSFQLHSTAPVNGHQTISLINGKIFQHPPHVCASAMLDSAIICTSRDGPIPRLVRRIGLREILKQQNEIEHSVAKAVASNLSKELQAEVSKQFAKFESEVISNLLLNTKRVGLLSDEVSSSSSARNSSFRAIVGTEYSMGAPAAPPANRTSGIMQLRIHQSLLNSLFFRTLAGRDVADLSKTLASFGITLNEHAEMKAAGLGVMGITFAEDSPMTLKVQRSSDGTCLLELRISGTSYRFDQFRLSAMDFVARFQLKKEGQQLSLIREGDIAVLPPPSGSSLRFIQQKQIVYARLQALFPKRQQFPIRKLVSDLTGNDFAYAVDVSADEGWLNLELEANGLTSMP